MNCIVIYLDPAGQEQKFYWLSNNYEQDYEKAIQQQGIKYKEIKGIYTSD